MQPDALSTERSSRWRRCLDGCIRVRGIDKCDAIGAGIGAASCRGLTADVDPFDSVFSCCGPVGCRAHKPSTRIPAQVVVVLQLAERLEQRHRTAETLAHSRQMAFDSLVEPSDTFDWISTEGSYPPPMGGLVMVTVAPPIVVQNQGEVILFDSIDDTQLWMEAVDVRNNEYEIFDSTGLRLGPHVVTGRIETVKISVQEPQSRDVDRLRGILFDFVVRGAKTSEQRASKMGVGELLALIQRR